MKRELNGAELAEFIKERQAHAVRGLLQSEAIQPAIAIIRTNPEQIVDSYMRIKQTYGDDIGVSVVVHTVDQSEALERIEELNNNSDIHGIVVQIPLPDVTKTDETLNRVIKTKDVDGLAENTMFEAPTPMAINWLLSGYNIELRGKNIVIVGHGRLVGKPLQKLWLSSGLEPVIIDKQTSSIAKDLKLADIIVSATGVPGLITADMVKADAVIVDAGVATDSNGLVGDVSNEVRNLAGVTMTPIKGGVGPLTVAALFENVITAARSSIAQR